MAHYSMRKVWVDDDGRGLVLRTLPRRQPKGVLTRAKRRRVDYHTELRRQYNYLYAMEAFVARMGSVHGRVSASDQRAYRSGNMCCPPAGVDGVRIRGSNVARLGYTHGRVSANARRAYELGNVCHRHAELHCGVGGLIAELGEG